MVSVGEFSGCFGQVFIGHSICQKAEGAQGLFSYFPYPKQIIATGKPTCKIRYATNA